MSTDRAGQLLAKRPQPDNGVVYAPRLLSRMVFGPGTVTVLALVAALWLVGPYAPGCTAEQRDLTGVQSVLITADPVLGVSATAGVVLNIRGRDRRTDLGAAVHTW